MLKIKIRTRKRNEIIVVRKTEHQVDSILAPQGRFATNQGQTIPQPQVVHVEVVILLPDVVFHPAPPAVAALASIAHDGAALLCSVPVPESILCEGHVGSRFGRPQSAAVKRIHSFFEQKI